jgi:hypothetical protein
MPPQRKKRATNKERHFNFVQNGNLRALKRQVSHQDCDLENDRNRHGYTYLHRYICMMINEQKGNVYDLIYQIINVSKLHKFAKAIIM